MKKRAAFLLLLCLLLAASTFAFAHSGGTDSKGGHIDHSTGLYHYHHGYPAHQHTNGVCPYKTSTTTTKTATTTSSQSSNSTASSAQQKSDDGGLSVGQILIGAACGAAVGIPLYNKFSHPQTH